MQYAIVIQEGFGSDGQTIFFCAEAPTYHTEQIPVFARMAEMENPTHVGDREETFVSFVPKNGNRHRRGRTNQVPFNRVLGVIPFEEDSDV